MKKMLGAGAAAAVLTLMSVTPAHAGSWTDGPTEMLTLWQNDSYEGQAESRSSYDNDFGNDSCSGCDIGPGGNFEDDASSVVNRTAYYWGLYEHDNQGGKLVCIKPRSHDANLGADLEDEISSVKKLTKTEPSQCTTTIGAAN